MFGIGSYTLASTSSRDTLGMAVKATAAKVDGKWIEIFKDPITDSKKSKKSKKSAKGLLSVKKTNGQFELIDSVSVEEEQSCENLEVVFLNGRIVKEQNFSDIRNRANEIV